MVVMVLLGTNGHRDTKKLPRQVVAFLIKNENKKESELVSPQHNPHFHLQWFAGSTPVVATHCVSKGGAF